ncbi:uncharacterized protein LOC105644442 isoform X3 [Jatropha curcas]|uniref:uncharacterized protein LOC105644442 isoform X3 n=1 Tax=Jatropha curcas TaxID=180498 RepID=UPI0009D68716|nr:uncharacterized protein LOC105644442 isoform X3 [Jatropha curcas]
MKRKSSQINIEDRSPIRSSFARGFYGVKSSKARLNATSRETQGIDNGELQESPSVPIQRNQAPRSDDPKTSEFAFFKKLKEDAAHNSLPHSLSQNKNQSVKFKSTDCSRERASVIENKHNDFKSSSLPKNVTPDNFASFLSPLGNSSKKSGVDIKKSSTTWIDIHSAQEKVKEYGNRCSNADVFTRKRQKLRQLVANTSFPEVDKLCSKGYDIVSALLSKLFPESNEDQSFGLLETRKLDIDAKSRSFTSPESDMDFKKSDWMPKRNFLELECGASFDVEFSSCWSEIPRALPNPNSPGCYFQTTYSDNRIMEVDHEIGERTAPILCTKVDSAFDFHINRHRSLTMGHLKEFDEFHYPIKTVHRKPQALLLGGELDNAINKELSLCPVLSGSYGNDLQLNLDNHVISGGLTASSLQFAPSTSNNSDNFEECFLQVKDDNIVKVINNFLLPLSHAANHLNSSDYYRYDTTFKDSRVLLSPQNHLWFIRKELNEDHYCLNKEALFSPGLDFYLEPKCVLPVRDSLKDDYSYACPALEFHRNEGLSSYYLLGDENANCLDGLSNKKIMNDETVNFNDWSTFYFEKKVCSLLLDKSNRYESEGDI